MTEALVKFGGGVQQMEFGGKAGHLITMYWDKPTDKYPCFVAKEPCKILGIKTKDLRSTLESEYIREVNVDSIDIYSADGKRHGRKPLAITLPGLFQMLFISRKKAAKEFQRWVYEEVLPSILMNGYYVAKAEYEGLLTSKDDEVTSLKAEIQRLTQELDAEMKFAGEMVRSRDGWMANALTLRDTAIKYVPVSTEENAKGKTPVRGALRKTPEPRLDKSYVKALRKTLKTHTIEDWLLDKIKACYEANKLKGKGARLTKDENEVIALANSGSLKIQTTMFH